MRYPSEADLVLPCTRPLQIQSKPFSHTTQLQIDQQLWPGQPVHVACRHWHNAHWYLSVRRTLSLVLTPVLSWTSPQIHATPWSSLTLNWEQLYQNTISTSWARRRKELNTTWLLRSNNQPRFKVKWNFFFFNFAVNTSPHLITLFESLIFLF